MKIASNRLDLLLLTGAAALALAVSPVAVDFSVNSGISTAAAQQKGGQGKGQQGSGKGQQGSGKGGGSSASTQDALRGKPASPGSGGSGGSGSSSSASKLGRLSMARSFLSPGFDISKVDDPDAPIAQIYAYSQVIAAPLPADDPATTENEQTAAITAAGTSLGTAATVTPVTLATVKQVNSLAGFTTTWSDTALTEVASVATATVEARRSEEGEE